MKISAINSQTKPVFTGERSNKDKLKNTAGAAAIALAALVPAQESQAQFVTYPGIYYTEVYTPKTIVPSCFLNGDSRHIKMNKTRADIFSELDANKSGTISLNETLKTDMRNWNLNNIIPYTNIQLQQAKNRFNTLSIMYNEENSNPETINFNEYNTIMDNYFEERGVNNFVPVYPYPLYVPFLPPPHHHHHPAPPPRHHHRH